MVIYINRKPRIYSPLHNPFLYTHTRAYAARVYISIIRKPHKVSYPFFRARGHFNPHCANWPPPPVWPRHRRYHYYRTLLLLQHWSKNLNWFENRIACAPLPAAAACIFINKAAGRRLFTHASRPRAAKEKECVGRPRICMRNPAAIDSVIKTPLIRRTLVSRSCCCSSSSCLFFRPLFVRASVSPPLYIARRRKFPEKTSQRVRARGSAGDKNHLNERRRRHRSGGWTLQIYLLNF